MLECPQDVLTSGLFVSKGEAERHDKLHVLYAIHSVRYCDIAIFGLLLIASGLGDVTGPADICLTHERLHSGLYVNVEDGNPGIEFKTYEHIVSGHVSKCQLGVHSVKELQARIPCVGGQHINVYVLGDGAAHAELLVEEKYGERGDEGGIEISLFSGLELGSDHGAAGILKLGIVHVLLGVAFPVKGSIEQRGGHAREHLHSNQLGIQQPGEALLDRCSGEVCLWCNGIPVCRYGRAVLAPCQDALMSPFRVGEDRFQLESGRRRNPCFNGKPFQGLI